MEQPLITIIYDCSCQTREEIYAWVGKQEGKNQEQSEAIKQELLKRESIGSIQVAPEIVLPHLEWEALTASRIYFIHLRTALHPWSDQIDEVKVVIVVLLKTNETQARKYQMIALMHRLADDTLTNQLRIARTEEAFILSIQNLCRKD